MDSIKIVREIIFSHGRLSIVRDTWRESDGNKKEYTYLKKAGGVVILPVYDNGDMLFINQYRYLVGQKCLELPAGGIENGESPLAAAKRELFEETGYRTDELHEMTVFYPSNGISSEKVYAFLCNITTDSGPLKEPEDGIDLHRLKKVEVIKLLASGEIKGASSFIALSCYMMNI